MITQPMSSGELTTHNRIVRSSTAECMCTANGDVTPDLLSLYSRLSEGGAGMIITGGASVHHTGHTYPGVIGVDNDQLLPGLRSLARIIKQHGSRAILQLYHCGRQKAPGYGQALAPSPVTDRIVGITPRQMTIQEIETMIHAFASAALRAKQAGFCGIQVAACNGHLIGQFLSPYTNRRSDTFGGSPDSRRRFMVETIRAIRAAVGARYPVLIKLGVNDFVPGGLEEDEAISALIACLPYGITAVEVTGGIYETSFLMSRGSIPIKTIMKLPDVRKRSWSQRMFLRTLLSLMARRSRLTDEAYFRSAAQRVRYYTGLPVITVGGLRSRRICDDILDSRDADMVAFSRPFIAEPGFASRLLADPDTVSRCVSCNECLIAIANGLPLACYRTT